MQALGVKGRGVIAIKIDNSLSNASARLAGLAGQLPYATSRALNATGAAVKAAMPAALEQALDRPTPFTKNGTFITRSNKSDLRTVVGFKSIQSRYLQYQINGGVRAPAGKALRLPAAINLNEFGNIPRNLIAQLVAVANKERKLTKRKSRLIKVSNKVELFYGDPKDVGGHKFPPGIYKRIATGGKHQLIPLIVFPQANAKYRKRFDFYGISRRIVRQEFPTQFSQAFRQAIESAR